MPTENANPTQQESAAGADGGSDQSNENKGGAAPQADKGGSKKPAAADPEQAPKPKVEPEAPVITADHPDVKAILEAKKTEWEKQKAKEAERAKMDETERLKAELEDLKKTKGEAEATAVSQKVTNDLWRHMSRADSPKVQPGADDLLEGLVQKFVAAAPNKTAADAVAALKKSHGFLFADGAPAAGGDKGQGENKGSSNGGAGADGQKPITTTPLPGNQGGGGKTTKHPRDMTQAEYAAYKKEKGLG